MSTVQQQPNQWCAINTVSVKHLKHSTVWAAKKVGNSIPARANTTLSPGSKKTGPFPSRFQLWILFLLSSDPHWGLVFGLNTGEGF